MTKVGAALAKLGLQYSRIYTSPLVRAVQTAEILAATHPRFKGSLTVEPALSIDKGSITEALQPLEDADDADLIVMVTHMPKVAALAAQLCDASAAPSFRTASACLLSIKKGKGRIEWMLDPHTLALRRH